MNKLLQEIVDYLNSPKGQAETEATLAALLEEARQEKIALKEYIELGFYDSDLKILLNYIEDSNSCIDMENLAYFPEVYPFSLETVEWFLKAFCYKHRKSLMEDHKPDYSFQHTEYVGDGLSVFTLFGQGSCTTISRLINNEK